jgi:TP901 family phage tail tape measure protein
MASKTDKYAIQFDIVGINKLTKYQQGLQKTNKDLKKLKKEIDKNQTATAAQANKLSRLTAQRQMYNRKVKDGIAALKGNTAAQNRNSRAMAMGGKAMTAMGLSVAGAVMAFRRLTQFLMSNVKEFAKFERGVKNVTTLMNEDDTGFFRGDLFRGSLKLSKDFGFALDDVNKSMFNAVSAGIKGGEAIEFLGEAAKLAVAGVTTLKSTTLGLTTVLNAYGLEASEAERVSNILFTTQKFGVTTVEELSKSLGVVVPFAAASGISIEELGAAIAVTTRSGLDAAKTVTALRAAISQMQKPAAESRDLFLQYGIPIGAAEMKAVGFTETLRRLNKVYKESPEVIEQMFGNVRGLTAIFSLAGDNAESYNEILSETADESLTAANAAKALEENFDSTQMSIDRMSSAWNAFKVSLGDAAWFRQAIESTTNYLNVFSNENLSGYQKFLSFQGIFNPFASSSDMTGFNTTMLNYANEEQNQKDADEFTKFLDGNRMRLNQLVGRAETGVMNLTTKDLTDIELVLSKEGLQEYNSTIKQYIGIFSGIMEDRRKIMDDDQAKQDAADALSTENKRKFNELERSSRIKLQEDISTLTEAQIESGSNANVLELAILQAKLQREEDLLKEFNDRNLTNIKQKDTLEANISKFRLAIKKKERTIEMTDGDNFIRERLDAEKMFGAAKINLSRAQANNEKLTNIERKKAQIQLEIDHVDELLRVGKETGEMSEKTEAALLIRKGKLLDRMNRNEVKGIRDKEKAKLDLIKMGVDKAAEAAQNALQTRLENEERALDKRRERTNQELSDGLINNREAAAIQDQIDRDAFNKRKEHEKKALTISFMQELAQHRIQAAGNPANMVTFGAAGISQYAIMSAISLAAYIANMGTINAQQFARGGMVYGKSHARGGERFAVGGRVVELEGGEAVINKRSTAMFGGALSAMNVAGGGKAFSAPNIGSQSLIDYNLLGQAIGRNTNVVMPVESFRKTSNNVKAIENSVKF